jgi:hypothetical protein
MHPLNERTPRIRALVASVATALGAAIDCNGAAFDAAKQALPEHVQSTWQVLNCNDAGAGSLRDMIQNHAHSGDIVDLTQVPSKCGAVHSTITLSSGEIAIPQDELTLIGPQPAVGSVTVSGSPTSRVFNQTGVGFLQVNSLAITDGHYETSGPARGGCIESKGQVYLLKSSVTGCTVSSTSQQAYGGGIDANSVRLIKSTVSGNEAFVMSARSNGGGISCVSLTAKYSSISSNIAHDGGPSAGVGGGAFVASSLYIESSTVDYNTAGFGGGLKIAGGQGRIVNSTISGNFADLDFGAVEASGDYFGVFNSTIAFNYSISAFAGPKGALMFAGTSAASTLMLQSSIVAKNTAASAHTPADVYLGYGYPGGQEVLSGADNLVIASNALAAPPGVITVTSDPMLSPLDMHGGWTRTHVLLRGSLAIGAGNNDGSYQAEQRGRGYPRSSGPVDETDIGAAQFDSIFFDDFEGS